MMTLNIIHSWLVYIKVLEVVSSYLQKYVFQKAKDINVKAFNMIRKKGEAKSMTEHKIMWL